jgi:hypothetical protein
VSTFSYLAPSGGVRAFALGRIASNYANRVMLHAAALRPITTAACGSTTAPPQRPVRVERGPGSR